MSWTQLRWFDHVRRAYGINKSLVKVVDQDQEKFVEKPLDIIRVTRALKKIQP